MSTGQPELLHAKLRRAAVYRFGVPNHQGKEERGPSATGGRGIFDAFFDLILSWGDALCSFLKSLRTG